MLATGRCSVESCAPPLAAIWPSYPGWPVESGISRLSILVRQVRQGRDGDAPEQGGPVRGRRRRRGTGRPGQRLDAGQPPGLDLRSGGTQGVSGRHLHVDDVLQGEQGPEEGGRAAGDGGVLPDRRQEGERGDGLRAAARAGGGRGAQGVREHPVILLDAGARPASVSKPPTSWDYFADRAFRVMAQGAVWLIVLLLAYLLWSIGTKAWLGIREHGLGFLTSASWDVGRQQFGILPHIWGTLYSS